MTFYESFGVMMSLLRVVGRRGAVRGEEGAGCGGGARRSGEGIGEGVGRRCGEEGW